MMLDGVQIHILDDETGEYYTHIPLLCAHNILWFLDSICSFELSIDEEPPCFRRIVDKGLTVEHKEQSLMTIFSLS